MATVSTAPVPTGDASERSSVDALIREIVSACPRRLASTDCERAAQDILGGAMRDAGLDTELVGFRYNKNLYATLALHFGVATAGTAALLMGMPWLALPLHLLAAISYLLDSTRSAFLLRRLFPFRQSQNLVGVRPVSGGGEPALRVVLVAHADAAYTGLVFHPSLIRHATREPPIAALRFMRKGLRVATGSVFALAAFDVGVANGLAPPGVASWIAVGLGVPAALAFLLNLEVVLRNRIVPGANDNLSGCAGTVVLAERLRDLRPDDLELVMVCTGAEEAGTGGAWALARQRLDAWAADRTVVLAIDGLTNGALRYFAEGEIVSHPVPPRLEAAAQRVAGTDPRFADLRRFEIPTGATDAIGFITAGYEAMGIGCVDPDIGAPRHYHRPSDTPDNLDLDQLMVTIDFIEALVRDIARERLG